ncbi:hypothetical protein PI125_g1567 [Phytophthora idaei]|nr:hypothetical protein PI125_g1567 [Phytophthora idaei]
MVSPSLLSLGPLTDRALLKPGATSLLPSVPSAARPPRPALVRIPLLAYYSCPYASWLALPQRPVPQQLQSKLRLLLIVLSPVFSYFTYPYP